MHLEVLAEVRRRVGTRFPIFIRLGAHDETPGGLESEDAGQAATLLANAGIDLIDISGGLQGSRGTGKDPGYFVPYAEAIKGRVHVPVMVTGGIREAAYADRIIRTGQADLVGIGRGMLEDPDWARKAITFLSG